MAGLQRKRVLLSLLLFLVACLAIVSLHSPRDDPPYFGSPLARAKAALATVSPSSTGPASKNAFCVFLAEPNEALKENEDPYYDGVRMLVYQLLYDPHTRTRAGVSFVVVVSDNVPQWKRDQLTHEGAVVVPVPHINIPWIKPGRPRWKYVMDKLHVFELVQYDKILLLDTDMVVTQPLDGVFDDPVAQVLENKQNPKKIREDEGTQPAQYLMAGNGVNDVEHTYPTARHGRLNAGFVLFKPSIEMYKHYLTVAMIEGRFPGGSPEQDLWNYIHRSDGNMPWQQLNPDWTINSPNIGDYEHGIATIHEKWWRCKEPKLREVLLRSRWLMEGFFQGYDAKSWSNTL